MPNWNIQNIGSSLSLPAHGRAGARATSSLAAHFAKRNTKFGGGGKARAGLEGETSFPYGVKIFARPRFSAAAEFRISLCEMRRQRRCCPCPSSPVRRQRQGTPFLFAKF